MPFFGEHQDRTRAVCTLASGSRQPSSLICLGRSVLLGSSVVLDRTRVFRRRPGYQVVPPGQWAFGRRFSTGGFRWTGRRAGTTPQRIGRRPAAGYWPSPVAHRGAAARRSSTVTRGAGRPSQSNSTAVFDGVADGKAGGGPPFGAAAAVGLAGDGLGDRAGTGCGTAASATCTRRPLCDPGGRPSTPEQRRCKGTSRSWLMSRALIGRQYREGIFTFWATRGGDCGGEC